MTGDPGNVVATFGNYVGGGDIVIGIIIFIKREYQTFYCQSQFGDTRDIR